MTAPNSKPSILTSLKSEWNICLANIKQYFMLVWSRALLSPVTELAKGASWSDRGVVEDRTENFPRTIQLWKHQFSKGMTLHRQITHFQLIQPNFFTDE